MYTYHKGGHVGAQSVVRHTTPPTQSLCPDEYISVVEHCVVLPHLVVLCTHPPPLYTHTERHDALSMGNVVTCHQLIFSHAIGRGKKHHIASQISTEQS